MCFKDVIRIIAEKTTDMTEVTEIMDCVMDKIKERIPDLYRETMHELKGIAYEITPDEARRIVKAMRPHGQRWDYDTIKSFIETKGTSTKTCEYYLCMNMAYNDYHKTADIVGRGEDPEFYFSIAHDFIEDVDGKDFKVERYFLE